MRIVVIGAGPSGLYFSLLARKFLPSATIQVYEQNRRGATYGFGVVLADRGLAHFRDAHEESYEAFMAASFVSRNRMISHPDESIFVEGGGYGAAIARLRLLEILERCCDKDGIAINYETHVTDANPYADADLVVGADGIKSEVRRCHQLAFGTRSYSLTNRVAWYGTTRHFPHPLLSFKRNEFGHFVAAAYAYSERMSTFVAECDEATYFRAGLDRLSEEEQRKFTESVFTDELQRHELIGNNSSYRRLPVVRNQEWYAGNRVLIGDALHSSHPTIGSGTRIAMEDAIALAKALLEHRDDISAALAGFRRAREPDKHKLILASEKSFTWYESFASKVEAFGAIDFAFEFLMRTGRVGRERLLIEYPHFMSRYGHRWRAQAITA
jgi:2-polyprenyl-6-methoxyphenol hydroxylase-like FAD-dependent oxidoreductase